MDYYLLLDSAVELGYQLAMSGAETYRVEDSISRVLMTYGIQAEVFAIPNNLIVSIETPEGKPMTRMRRIGQHGNDLNAVDIYNGLSRAICNRKPEPRQIRHWLEYVRGLRRSYSLFMNMVGNFLGAGGFCLFFGGTWLDSLWAGFCGILVGLVTGFLDKIKSNQFFNTIAASFLMALAAYGFNAAGLATHVDSVIIGTLMILVPGLLFTNAMRDIIYGDTNSGVNRIVQVFLIAAALALGTAAAWNVTATLWGVPGEVRAGQWGFWMQNFASFIGCIGFAILFNIHGRSVFLAALGGMLTWSVYLIVMDLGGGDIAANFWAALFGGFLAELMARMQKKPALTYLVIFIFPLLPGAGVYYTMDYAVRGQMEMFVYKGMYTAAVAGVMAVGILLASTTMRVTQVWKAQRR